MSDGDSSERSDHGEWPEHEAERRKVVERIIPELIKKFIEVGVGKLAQGPKDLRHFVSEMRLPHEAASYVFSQIDDTKNGLYRVVAQEMRDFLEHTNLAEEISKVLTKLSFEIRTEIRFVPNATDERLFPKPEVKAEVSIGKESRRLRRSRKKNAPSGAHAKSQAPVDASNVTKKPKVAGEIVSHCRKCGLDLNHIVVAMVAGQPKKVLCQTCKTEHAYHRPAEEPGTSSSVKPKRATRSSAGSRASKAEAEAESLSSREKHWRDRTSGHGASAFAAYNPRTSFRADQLVRHPKFGDGFVARVIDVGKIEVMFGDGPRTLAHGLSLPG